MNPCDIDVQENIDIDYPVEMVYIQTNNRVTRRAFKSMIDLVQYSVYVFGGLVPNIVSITQYV